MLTEIFVRPVQSSWWKGAGGLWGCTLISLRRSLDKDDLNWSFGHLQPCVECPAVVDSVPRHLCPAVWGCGGAGQPGLVCGAGSKPALAGNWQREESRECCRRWDLTLGWGESGLLLKMLQMWKVTWELLYRVCILEVTSWCKRGAAFHTSSIYRSLVTWINGSRNRLS